MTLRFGTDGVRGVANAELTAELVTALGRAAVRGARRRAAVRRRPRHPPLRARCSKPRWSRASAPRVPTSSLAGVLPTPGVAYLARERGAAGGGDLRQPQPLRGQRHQALRAGRPQAPRPDRGARSRTSCATLADGDARGRAEGHGRRDRVRAPRRARRLRGATSWSRSRAVASTACTSSSTAGTAPRSAPRPRRCGRSVPRSRCCTRHPTARTSTTAAAPPHPEELQAAVLAARADDRPGVRRRRRPRDRGRRAGRARSTATRCSRSPRSTSTTAGCLRGNAVVDHRDVEPRAASGRSTRYGIELVETPVGDRNVLDELERRDLVLGGEQSGHVINMLHAATGDGTLTGIVLLDVMARRVRPLSELAAVMTRLPQVLRNVAVDDPEALNADTVFWSRVRDVDDELGDDGRVLVRPSGTEPLVRVMVESRDLADAESAADRLVALIEHVARAKSASRPLDLLTMCGIVGVVRRRARRTPPDPTALAADLVEALAVLNSNAPLGDRLGDTATLVSARRLGAARRPRRARVARRAERLGRARRPARCALAPARRDRTRPRPRCRGGDGRGGDRARQLVADPGP